MLDDYKYSINRIVAYSHPDPTHPEEAYGPGGTERTYGIVTGVHPVDGSSPHWEYQVRNSLTGEECTVREAEIFHGANMGYLDLRRREGIRWEASPPESARNGAESGFWRYTLKDFVRTAVPEIRRREIDEERERGDGRNLPLAEGDYIKVRGDVRPEMESRHNLYAKVLSVSPADRSELAVPTGNSGHRQHRTLSMYHVRFDDGEEADVYDVEIKVVYTTHGRKVVLNWRAATFLSEAFGDNPPYEVHLEYLNGHIFTRAELEGMSSEDMGDLLARLLYAKGLITWEELDGKSRTLSRTPEGFLVDQILDLSRFDMTKNRAMSQAEIERQRSDDERLRNLLG